MTNKFQSSRKIQKMIVIGLSIVFIAFLLYAISSYYEMDTINDFISYFSR